MALYEIVSWHAGQIMGAVYRRRADAADQCFRVAIDEAIDAESMRDRPAGLYAFRKGKHINDLHMRDRAFRKGTYSFAYAVSVGNHKVTYRNCQDLEPLEVRLPCHLTPYGVDPGS